MGKRDQQKNVDLPLLGRAATIQPDTIDEERRTVEVVWTTGQRVLRGYYDRYWEELSLDPKHVRMDFLNSGNAPLLDAHNAGELDAVIGVVERAWLMKKEGRAVVRFDKGARGEEIWRKVKDKIVRQISVGYRTYKAEKTEDGEDKIPVYRSIDWEPKEISPVPIGADDGAGFRAAGADQAPNTCVFVTRQERTMENEGNGNGNITEGSPAEQATRAAREARIEDAKARAAIAESAKEEAIAAERTRSAGIRQVATRSKLGEAWAATLIERGCSVEEARDAAFKHITNDDAEFSTDGVTRIGAGDDESEKFVRGASAWLFQRSGARSLLERAKKKDPELFKDVTFDAGEFRGYSPMELARLCLERRGVKTRGMDPMAMVGLAFTHRTNYQTAGDFPILLENVLGKVLLGAYATQSSTWERFCKVEEVSDFRVSNRYRTGSFTGLDVIPEHGEYKSGVIPDGSKYPVSTQRLGKMFALSREAIVNDDMGALMDQASKMGAAAQRTIENAVYALLALNSGLGPTQGDSQPFFHANRANVNATGSALSVSGIDADRVVMRNQKDPAALDYLDLNPAVLLVPESLKGLGLQINESVFDVSVSNKFQVPNMVRGLFREVVASPRLTGTRRYIIADTMDMIVVAFLGGYGRGPVLESQQGWRTDGVEWKVTVYAKPQMGDPKAGVTNAGV